MITVKIVDMDIFNTQFLTEEKKSSTFPLFIRLREVLKSALLLDNLDLSPRKNFLSPMTTFMIEVSVVHTETLFKSRHRDRDDILRY